MFVLVLVLVYGILIHSFCEVYFVLLSCSWLYDMIYYRSTGDGSTEVVNIRSHAFGVVLSFSSKLVIQSLLIFAISGKALK